MTANGQSYVLESCGSAGHVWKQINTTNAQEAESLALPSSVTAVPKRLDHSGLLRVAAADNTTMATYSIKFYYTPEFAAVTSDIPLWVAQILTETNQGYANSQVPLKAVLCEIEAGRPVWI